MNNEIFEKIQLEFSESMTITPDNIQSKLLELPKIHSKFLNLYIKEKRLLKDINNQVDGIYKKIYHEYKFNKNYELKPNELDRYVYADEEFSKIKLQSEKQMVYVEYLEKLLQILTGVGFQIGKYVDLEKIKNGLG